MTHPSDLDSLDDVPPVVEFGGAIGRTASAACRQGQHDLCTDDSCLCRHHGRVPGDPGAMTVHIDSAHECLYCPDTVCFAPGTGWVHLVDGRHLRVRTDDDGTVRDDHYATPDYDKPRQ